MGRVMGVWGVERLRPGSEWARFGKVMEKVPGTVGASEIRTPKGPRIRNVRIADDGSSCCGGGLRCRGAADPGTG